MPLPPALVARLAKRGLVDENLVKTNHEKRVRADVEEEVIAENYDTNIKNLRNSSSLTFSQDEITSVQAEKQFKGHSGCPNKWNVFHECSSFCVRNWGKGITKPDSKYLRKQARLMIKYPLSSNWKEVYDPGTGRHYYWEMTSDMVSWLPPGHPKAVISESAATIREDRHLAATDCSDHDSDSQEEEEEETPDQIISEERHEREFKKPVESRSKVKPNDIDPMDPAAYSDAPRGRWSDGLEKGNEAKTGADVTAAGPLYQMRPYPSPGAVLRANAANKSTH
jgi:polyglutamine-binding protein 1